MEAEEYAFMPGAEEHRRWYQRMRRARRSPFDRCYGPGAEPRILNARRDLPFGSTVAAAGRKP